MINTSLAQRIDPKTASLLLGQRQDSVHLDTGLSRVDGGSGNVMPPLMSRSAFAKAIGVPEGVLVAQAERGYWPQITVGKRVFINVEAVRMKAAERAAEFTL